ncbi:MAG: SpoIID/LytB domain-containing protein [Acidimicrobiia bacterium]|nr:SpoIID/LytB domain-containing protein [Acidimicrobiia bacterium]
MLLAAPAVGPGSVTIVSQQVEAVSLTPEAGTTLSLGRGAYEGTLDITSHHAGLAAVEETTIDRYLLGITEVPSSWPDESLAAQAVAARTYLAWTLFRGRSINGTKYDYDICASQFCQVYRGPGGAADAWATAVNRTGGEILVYEGSPAQALYSSSAGSRTRSVQDIWGGAGVPYLEAVDSPELAYTPYERWELVVTTDVFQRVFARSGYDFGARIEDVSLRSPGEGNGPESVEVRTEQGVTPIPATRFRAIFNVHGPDLYPGLMPAARPTGGRWPQTVLSYSFEVGYEPPRPERHRLLPPGETGATGTLTVVGEGWGHGVGMSQWGAMAMASGGSSYESILDHYYGLEPSDGAGRLPATVRVGLLVEQPAIEVLADGPFVLEAPGFDPVEVPAGEWVFRRSGSGLVIVGPSGAVYDSPLFRRIRWQPR